MKYETDGSKLDWNAIQSDSSKALHKIKTAWNYTQKHLPAEVHAQFVKNIYMPSIHKLASFCHHVDQHIEVENVDND